MTVTHDRVRSARHEAGHVAGLVLRGRLPRRVTADWPKPGIAGEMVVDWGDEGCTPDSAAAVAISVLLGPIAEGNPSWPPTWPLEEDTRGDERDLAILLRYLKVDEANYIALCAEARTLAKTPEFVRLVGLVARALELKDELDAGDLRRLLGPKILHTYGIEQE